ncbi:TPA: hypothetical protein QH957_002279 [Enterobacter bugandensis]|nr:hypothetical protein [Enterobacter bugandensis]
MSLFDGKLSMMTIEAHKCTNEAQNKYSKVGAMQVKFNPNAIQFGMSAEHTELDAINKTATGTQFVSAMPPTLTLNLLFGDTTQAAEETIQNEVETFKNLCGGVNSKKDGKPLLLKVFWGDMLWAGKKSFEGHMTSLSIQYVRFNRKGKPLRANITLSLKARIDLEYEEPTLPLGNIVNVPDMSTLASAAAISALVTAATGLTVSSLALANDLDTLGPPSAGDNLVTGG